MSIVITEEDSGLSLQQKLLQAEAEAREQLQTDIMALCGALKGKSEDDPVDIIRKMRDEEWN